MTGFTLLHLLILFPFRDDFLPKKEIQEKLNMMPQEEIGINPKPDNSYQRKIER